MTENVSDTLNKAADLIEERGWAIGNCGMAVEGPTCIEGAIAAVMGTDIGTADAPILGSDLPAGTPVYKYTSELHQSAAFVALRTHLDLRKGLELWPWNDENGRTANEVVEVLRATALIESARERKAAEVSA